MYDFNFSFVRSGTPIVTLSAVGIAFNAGVRNLLGFPEAIDIGFDEKTNTIGVCSHRPENEGNGFSFEGREKDGWVRISCRDFMRYLSSESGIEFTKAKQFIPTFDKDQNMLIIAVDKGHMKKLSKEDTKE